MNKSIKARRARLIGVDLPEPRSALRSHPIVCRVVRRGAARGVSQGRSNPHPPHGVPRSLSWQSTSRDAPLYIYIYIYTHVSLYIYIYMYMYVCIYIYIYTYVYIYIYMYVYIYIYMNTTSRVRPTPLPCPGGAGANKRRGAAGAEPAGHMVMVARPILILLLLLLLLLLIIIMIIITILILTTIIIMSNDRGFRDVVFEDVGFENSSWLTLNNCRCGDFTPKADMGEGLRTSILKPHILKHHIHEHLKWDVGLRALDTSLDIVHYEHVAGENCCLVLFRKKHGFKICPHPLRGILHWYLQHSTLVQHIISKLHAFWR